MVMVALSTTKEIAGMWTLRLIMGHLHYALTVVNCSSWKTWTFFEVVNLDIIEETQHKGQLATQLTIFLIHMIYIIIYIPFDTRPPGFYLKKTKKEDTSW